MKTEVESINKFAGNGPARQTPKSGEPDSGSGSGQFFL